MPNFPEILMLLALPILVAFSAFFSGCETAFFSLTSHQRLQLSRSANLVAGTIVRIIAERRHLLITLLLGNMVVNVTYFVISTMLLLRLHHQAPRWASVVLSIAPLVTLILLGEVLPKLVASRFSMEWSRLAAVPLWLIHRGLSPVRLLLSVIVVEPLSRLIAPPTKPKELSAEEMEALLDLSQKQGVIDVKEEELLQQVLSLSQLRVYDIMTPRVDIAAFDLADDPGVLVERIKQTRLSRLPVYVDDLDHIEGVVYARQVLLKKPTTQQEVRSLIRQVRFVPALQRADALLVELRKRGTTMAIAVDEYGGTAGLVTLEDVVEQMVGQIGPHDRRDNPQVVTIGNNRWRVSADLSVRDWDDVFGQPPGTRDVSTVGGLVMALLGKLPKAGDRTRLGNLVIEVEKMAGRRIDTLLIGLDGSAAAPAQGGAAA